MKKELTKEKAKWGIDGFPTYIVIKVVKDYLVVHEMDQTKTIYVFGHIHYTKS